MIYVTRLNHTPVVLNCDLIEHIETTPDTVISLTTGQKMMVLESADEVVDRVIRYRRSLLSPENMERTPHDSPDESISTGRDIHGRR
ncbi:MAG TPA: flagellar FlbD family protein [Bryobacteraceae bacterium]|nr:flagellar FlbD family protein [Bryobacteraceae bacterium]